MGLTGNLKTMKMPELLQWAASSAKSGELKIISGPVIKKIFFRNGYIIGAFSNLPSDYLGQMLLSYRKLNKEQLKEALTEQKNSDKKLGEIILQKGWLTEEELKDLIYIQVLEIIYSLFLLPDGEFVFTDNPSQAMELFNLKLPVEGIILEGIFRKDEWKRITKVFTSDDIIFEVAVPDALLNSSSYTDRKIYKLITKNKTLGEIAYNMRHPQFQIYRRLFELYEAGIIKIKMKKRRPKEEHIIYPEDLYQSAKEYEKRGKYEKAMVLYWKIYRMKGLKLDDTVWARKAMDRALKILKDRFVPIHKVPVLTLPLSHLLKLHFTPEEGYMISRIDGVWDVDSIVKVSPLPEVEALYFFKKLKDRGIIQLK